MNFLTKNRSKFLIVLVLLFLGYEMFLSRKLSPPANSEQITISFRVPEGVMLLPLGGVYVSSKCTNTRLTGAFKTYQEDATAGVSLPFVNGVDNLRTVSIAKDGGGRCKWKLLSIQVRFRAANDNPLAKGEKVVDTTYDFDFIGYGADGGGFGTSRTKEV